MRGAGWSYGYKFQRGVFEETDLFAVSLLAGLEASGLKTAGCPMAPQLALEMTPVLACMRGLGSFVNFGRKLVNPLYHLTTPKSRIDFILDSEWASRNTRSHKVIDSCR